MKSRFSVYKKHENWNETDGFYDEPDLMKKSQAVY